MKWRRDHGGFTQVELVVVILIAGILAAAAIPRFVARDVFESRGFFDEAIGIVRYAQKTAIAWRAPVFVCLSASQVMAATAAGCATPTLLKHPTTGTTLVTSSAPNGVTLSVVPGGDFTFDALGRPSISKTITINSTIAGDPTRQIVVEAETGYVHQ